MHHIQSLTHHALGRTDDGLLIPRTLPGETVELAPDGTPRILTPSPDRIAPPCRHFKSCGGCAIQHASDAFTAAWKRDIVARALSARGLAAEIVGPETSPPQSRRRARLSARRTKSGTLIGFHARASDTIIPIPDCRLLTPALMATFPALEALTRRAASRTTELGLTITETLNGPDLHIAADRPLDETLRHDLIQIARTHRLARLTWNDDPIVTLAPPALQIGPAQVVPPPAAFLQATTHGQDTLTRLVDAATAGARRIVDLFAGSGTFTLPLAIRADVHAVESDAAMLAALDRAWRATPGLHRITTEPRDLFRRPLDASDLRPFDAAAIDPPRAGAEAQVIELAASPVPVVAMVSCNPVTFARDAAILTAAGFRLGPVTVVDQFRWSPHVELATRFTRD
jgi:23S rRNA (uracil1939-C5)-methyltransferase